MNLALGVSLTIVLVTGGVSIWSGVHSRQVTRQRQEGFVWQMALAQLLSSVQEAETGQRGYLLTGKSEYLQPYHIALDSVPTRLGRAAGSWRGIPPRRRRSRSCSPWWAGRWRS